MSAPNAESMRVTYASADDWAAIYINGELLHEGHSVPSFVWVDVLRRCGIDVLDVSETSDAYVIVQETGGFPADDGWAQIDGLGVSSD